VLEANDRYILGRPRIDQIEIRFVSDPNAVSANLLAGAVEVVVGRSLGFEQAVAIRERWHDGHVSFSPSGSLKLWPNHLNPNPAVIGDARFRRALLQGIDREELMETLVAGLSSVAHTTVTPTEAGYREIERGIVRHAFDRASAIRTIEGLGYTRGGDGMFRDGSNKRLAVEMRVGVVDILQKATFAAADDWRQIGVATEVVAFPPQRQDFEYIATRPGFYTTRGNSGFQGLKSFHSTEAQTPANRYTGRNTGNYTNPAMDSLIDRYLRTVSWAERMRTAAEIVHHQTDQVIVLNLFYDASPHFIGNRLTHVPNAVGGDGSMTWNVHEWDLKRDG
jgi:peptide/nickel transport system substrate-binding protein